MTKIGRSTGSIDNGHRVCRSNTNKYNTEKHFTVISEKIT